MLWIARQRLYHQSKDETAQRQCQQALAFYRDAAVHQLTATVGQAYISVLRSWPVKSNRVLGTRGAWSTMRLWLSGVVDEW